MQERREIALASSRLSMSHNEERGSKHRWISLFAKDCRNWHLPRCVQHGDYCRLMGVIQINEERAIDRIVPQNITPKFAVNLQSALKYFSRKATGLRHFKRFDLH
jgi:hypothetical protein